MRVVELDWAEPARPVPPGREDAWARDLLTYVLAPDNHASRGGSGCANKAFDCAGDAVCLKSMVPVRDAEPERRALVAAARRKAFLEEWRVQRALAGVPGVAQPVALGSYAGGPVVVMQWVEGETLRSLGSAGALPAGDARMTAGVGLGVLAALVAAERSGRPFAHRDLSPRNLMLRLDRRPLSAQLREGSPDVCLIDLGSAVLLGAGEKDGRRPPGDGAEAGDADSFTMRERIWRNGTAEYAPPEMLTHDVREAEERRLSSRIDVYALCGVLFELYASHAPWGLAARPDASPYRVKTESPVPTLEARRPADRPLADAVAAGLRPRQEARPTPSELAEALLPLASPAARAAYQRAVAGATPRAVGAAQRLPALPRSGGGARAADTGLPSDQGQEAALRRRP